MAPFLTEQSTAESRLSFTGNSRLGNFFSIAGVSDFFLFPIEPYFQNMRLETDV